MSKKGVIAAISYAILLSAEACKKLREDSAVLVTDGTKTDLYPAVMKLSDSRNEAAICTAALIERGVFLTAAHCVVESDQKTVRPFDVMSVGRDSIKFEVLKILFHPQYGGTWDTNHDIALVFVSERPRGPAISPLRICNRVARAGEAVTLIGYGMTHSNLAAPIDAGTKRMGANTVYEVMDDFIQVRGKTNWWKDSDPVAAAGEASSAVPGDSGSPLITPCGIVGVASGFYNEKSFRTLYAKSFYAAMNSLSSIEFLGNALKIGAFPEAPGAEHWTAIYDRPDRPRAEWRYDMTYEEATRLCHRKDFAKRFRLATIEEITRSVRLVEQSAIGPGCVWSRSKSDNPAFPITAFGFGGGSDHNGPFSASPSGGCQAFCVRVVDPEVPPAAASSVNSVVMKILRGPGPA